MALRETSSDHWDEAGFRTVFLQHYARIVSLLVRLLGDRTHAEEIANDAFWRLYRQPTLQVDGNVGGWLYRTATNLGIDQLRSTARRRQHEEAAGRQLQQDTADGPLQDLLREEKCGRVRQVLASIRPVQAQLLLLRSCGFSYRELADALDLKLASIGTMLNRAEEEFRKQYLALHPEEEL
jgi:RNA polymerase sigma factor (sigma-70 family)